MPGIFFVVGTNPRNSVPPVVEPRNGDTKPPPHHVSHAFDLLHDIEFIKVLIANAFVLVI